MYVHILTDKPTVKISLPAEYLLIIGGMLLPKEPNLLYVNLHGASQMHLLMYMCTFCIP